MKLSNSISTAMIVGALLAGISGCDRNDGAVEKAGKAVDQAAEQAGEQIEEAGEKIQNAAQGEDQ